MLKEKFIKLTRDENESLFVWIDPLEIASVQERARLTPENTLYTVVLLRQGGGVITVKETPVEIDRLADKIGGQR